MLNDGRVGVTENAKQNTLLAHVLVILPDNFAKVRCVVWASAQSRGGPAIVIHLKPQPHSLVCAKYEMKWGRGGISKSFSKLEGEIILSFCFQTFYLDPFSGCQSYCSDSRIQVPGDKRRDDFASLFMVRLDLVAITFKGLPWGHPGKKGAKNCPMYDQLNKPSTYKKGCLWKGWGQKEMT